MTSVAIHPTSMTNQLTHAASAFATPTGSSSGSSPSSGTAGASTITSSDFLTLLVTELKNQDPTQPTDPTAYVQQLVGVNSLEQLIDINTQLTSLGGTASSTSSAAGSTSSTSGTTGV